MKTTTVEFKLIGSLFEGFENQLEEVTVSGEIFVWKGGIARNLALKLNGKKYTSVQKDLDVYTGNVEKWKHLDDDVFPLHRDKNLRINWNLFLVDDISLNNCMVVQKGKRILMVYGKDYNCDSILPLGYNSLDAYQACKENWRALIFGYRYKELRIYLNQEIIRGQFHSGNLYNIPWLNKQGQKKIGRSEWLKFEMYVNKQLGVEYFQNQTKYEKEAAYWFPKEGY